MTRRISDEDAPFGKYETDETCNEVQYRAFEWRKGTDHDIIHTAMRAGYHDPFKGRVKYDELKCSDGENLYRLTIDGKPLLYSDEEKFGGWMTYHQLLCWLEGYRRLSHFQDFLAQPEE